MTLEIPGELIAVVPMKPPTSRGSKSRLAGVLDDDSRAALSLHLLQKVLHALNKSEASPKVWVIGGDEPVQAIAKEESARWLKDPSTDPPSQAEATAGGGLNGAVSFAVNAAFQEGAAAVLVLPGDLGLIRPQDVDELVEMSSGFSSLVLAGAESDGGTNAILAPAGMMVGPFFGPNSFSKHLEAALANGLSPVVASLPGLAFDLDTPNDLERFRQECPDLGKSLSQIKARYLSSASHENKAGKGTQ